MVFAWVDGGQVALHSEAAWLARSKGWQLHHVADVWAQADK